MEVYTLGVYDKWRNVGEILCPIWYDFCKSNVNGALHWMDNEKTYNIYSFNIKTKMIKQSLFGNSILELEASRVGELPVFDR